MSSSQRQISESLVQGMISIGRKLYTNLQMLGNDNEAILALVSDLGEFNTVLNKLQKNKSQYPSPEEKYEFLRHIFQIMDEAVQKNVHGQILKELTIDDIRDLQILTATISAVDYINNTNIGKENIEEFEKNARKYDKVLLETLESLSERSSEDIPDDVFEKLCSDIKEISNKPAKFDSLEQGNLNTANHRIQVIKEPSSITATSPSLPSNKLTSR